jgi:uncharacterized membrane protein YtjA (UPF0391 family)
MLRWAVLFLLVTLIAATLGFGGSVAGVAADVAKILFGVFLLLFVIGIVMHLVRGERTA